MQKKKIKTTMAPHRTQKNTKDMSFLYETYLFTGQNFCANIDLTDSNACARSQTNKQQKRGDLD